MRHVFYVHSHLTYIVASSIVDTHHLAIGDVLLLLGRSFAPPDRRLTAITLSPEVYGLTQVPSYGKPLLFLKCRSILNRIDAMLDRFSINQSYTVYLPSTRNFLMQFLATHKRCSAVHLLEEGLLTYTNEAVKATCETYGSSYFGRAIRWTRQLDHGYRSMYYSRDSRIIDSLVYSVSPDLQQYLPTRQVFLLQKLSVAPIPSNYILNNALVVFMDTIVEQNMTSVDSMVCAYQYAARQLLKGGALWVKFHPSQRFGESIAKAMDRSAIKFEIVPSNISPEAILLHSRNLTVLGIHSSLLYYAALWGHRGISLMKILNRIDNDFIGRHSVLHIPEVFYRRVVMPDSLESLH